MITDETRIDATAGWYENINVEEEVRSYEVSIWTLQDEFLTVLKWSDIEQKGRIEHPKMVLADDGTQSFDFSIPMYYDNGKGTKIPNPIWYNTRNGNLIENFRKIKVIFNKQTADEQVFDFLLVKINEDHEQDIPTCTVECEGLAFHELGKTGYKYDLSQDNFALEMEAWENSGDSIDDMPRATVDYWCKKIQLEPYPTESTTPIYPNRWYYKVDMDWSSFDEKYHRSSSKVYEEMYSTDWDENLRPTAVEAMREKERMVEIKESNRYNITQEIAKQFGIFCRYEYTYDSNYHIIGRTVVFFNNFIHDNHIMSFTYPYSTKKNGRERDGKDIVTKLYVRSMDDSTTILGEANISYCDANKTGEDYILNFDYLKETRAITDEQYAEINKYEKLMRQYNNELIPLSNKIALYENEKVELEANVTTYNNSVALDQENINQNSALAQALVANNGQGGYINAFNSSNPSRAMIITDDKGRYYINLNTQQKGIKVDTVRVYRNWSTQNGVTNEIGNLSFTYDTSGNPIRVYGMAPANNSSLVYLTYDYEPRLYYDRIVDMWTEKLYHDKKALEENTDALTELEATLATIKTQYENLLKEKEKTIQAFNEMMGPALREGYWQPENYQDYGENHIESRSLLTDAVQLAGLDTGNSFEVGWDDKLFAEEQDIYYEEGINQDKIVYPCINLSSFYSNFCSWLQTYDSVCVFFNNDPITTKDSYPLTDVKNIKSFTVGSDAILGFIKVNDGVIPALILTGAKSLTETELNFLITSDRHPSIGVFRTTVMNGVVTAVAQTLEELNANMFQFNTYNSLDVQSTAFVQNCKAVYPRIKFSSLMLKTAESDLFVHYNNVLLEDYKDYYIRNRSALEAVNYNPEYYITLKPQTIAMNYGNGARDVMVHYTLSNANTAIYLDALEVSKENAYPKVAYTIEPNLLDRSRMSTLYNKLSWLVMINDPQLQFRNVFGYISKLTLDLDAPWNDQIEVKNYKSKFEDLFSTIVAQTESMQRNENLLGSLSRGTYALSVAGLKNTLKTNNSTMVDYLAQNFLSSDPMNNYLAGILLEIGDILGMSNSALGELQGVNVAGNEFLNQISEQASYLRPTTFRSEAPPLEFKKNDTWVQLAQEDNQLVEVAQYVATANSIDARSGGTWGWTKISGGTYAQIHGAGIDIDADAGRIAIESDNLIEMHSKDVSVRGDGSVTIAGPEINILSQASESVASKINLVAKDGTGNKISEVIIDPSRISLGGSNITLFTGVGSAVSGIELNGTEGIKIGSSLGLLLYSGNSTVVGQATNEASVEITPTHILLGVANAANNNNTAIKMDDSQVIITAGASLSTVESSKITGVYVANTKLTGIKITKDRFSMAILANNTLNAVIINSNGITLGSTVTGIEDLGGSLNNASGSYVRISGNGITLNSQANLIVDTTNVKINAKSSPYFKVLKDNDNYIECTDSGLTVKGALTATSLSVGSGNNMLTYNNGTLTIKGNMSATTGTIGGWTIGGSSLSSGNVSLNSSGTYSINCNDNFLVTPNGDVYLKSLKIRNAANTGYETVNFATAFNKAVSLWGEWSSASNNGNASFTVYAQFYKSTALQVTESIQASFDPITIKVSKNSSFDNSGRCNTIYLTNGEVRSALSIWNKTTEISVDANSLVVATEVYNQGYDNGVAAASTDSYNQGWNTCLGACGIGGGGTVYTGLIGYYTNLYYFDSNGNLATASASGGYICTRAHTVSAK